MLPPFLPPLGKVSYLPLGRSRRPWTPATRRSPEPSSRFPLPNCRPKRVFFRGAGAVFSFLGFFPARGTAGARGNDLPEVGVKSFKERVCARRHRTDRRGIPPAYAPRYKGVEPPCPPYSSLTCGPLVVGSPLTAFAWPLLPRSPAPRSPLRPLCSPRRCSRAVPFSSCCARCPGPARWASNHNTDARALWRFCFVCVWGPLCPLRAAATRRRRRGHTHKRSFLGPARLRRAARPACQLCGG